MTASVHAPRRLVIHPAGSVDLEVHSSGAAIRFLHGELEQQAEPPSDAEPELFECTMPPGFGSQAHAHPEHELLYVLEGSVLVGATEVSAGGTVFVRANTLYQVRAGSLGCRFLAFRPRPARTIPKGEFLERRRSARTANDMP